MPKLRTLVAATLRAVSPGKSAPNPRLRLEHSSSRKKIRRIYRNVKRLNAPLVIDEAELAEHRRKWSVLQRRVGDKWYRTYSLLCGRQSRDYIPEDIYYSVVEPLLNNAESRPFLANKGMYQLVWGSGMFPRNIVRNVSGFDYDESFRRVDGDGWTALLAVEEKVVVKPSLHSGGGRNIQVFARADGKLENRRGDVLTPDYLKRTYATDYVVQEFVRQHEYFSRLNASSVNTLRVFTYRSVATDHVSILSHIVRMGRDGSEVDNENAGGMVCSVDPDGRLAAIGSDVIGRKYESAPGGQLFRDLPPVPAIEELRRTALLVASKLVDQRLLGVDLCMDGDGRVRVIEVNMHNLGINFHQMSDGPLFGKFTDEVIEHCRAQL